MNNNSALPVVHKLAWHHRGDKPLSELMMVISLNESIYTELTPEIVNTVCLENGLIFFILTKLAQF